MPQTSAVGGEFRSDANLENLKKQAKSLLRAIRAGDCQALLRLNEGRARSIDPKAAKLSDAQFAIARETGFASWPKLKAALANGTGISDGRNEVPLVPLRDLVLFPALRPIREALRDDPEAWYKLQEAGLVYWEWGQAEQAESMLLGAVRGGGGANPYPYFYLGQISERRGESDWARRYYQRAVEREASSPNPAFREALERVGSAVEQ